MSVIHNDDDDDDVDDDEEDDDDDGDDNNNNNNNNIEIWNKRWRNARICLENVCNCRTF